MARSPLSAVLSSLSDEEARALIMQLFNGAPSFDVTQHSDDTIRTFINAWLSSNAIAPNAVMLAASHVIARRAPPAPGIPAAPAYPAAPVVHTIATIPAPLVIPTLIPPAQPAPAAPYSAPFVVPPGDTPNPNFNPSPAQSLHAAVQSAVEEATDTAPAAQSPQPLQTTPNAPTNVSARSLFMDQPVAVVSAIPAALSVTVYNSPDAPHVNPIYAFDGPNLAAALASLACTPAQNVWLGGPRGTGKTEFVRQLAARLGRPFFRINFNRSTEAADFIGDLGLKDGNTQWTDGPAATARRTPGAVLLLDEITYAAQGHLAALNPILERNGEPLRLPRTGERLAPALHTVIFAADNTFGHGDTSGEYIARSAMGGDTLDRFARFLRFDYLPEALERKVLRAMVNAETGTQPSATMAKNVCKLMQVARSKADLGELTGAPSLRRAAAFCVALVQGFDPVVAYADTIIRAAPEDSQEALRQIYAATWPHDANVTPNLPPDGNPFAHTPGDTNV